MLSPSVSLGLEFETIVPSGRVTWPFPFTLGIPKPIIPSLSASSCPPSTTSLMPSLSESKSWKSGKPSPSVSLGFELEIFIPLISTTWPLISIFGVPKPISPSLSGSSLPPSTTSLIPSLSESKSWKSGKPSPSVSVGLEVETIVPSDKITCPSPFTSGIPIPIIPSLSASSCPPSTTSLMPSLSESKSK